MSGRCVSGPCTYSDLLSMLGHMLTVSNLTKTVPLDKFIINIINHTKPMVFIKLVPSASFCYMRKAKKKPGDKAAFLYFMLQFWS